MSGTGSAGVRRSIGLRHVALLLAGLAVLACAFAPRAEAFVYWADLAGGSIGRANNDGTAVDRSFISVPGGPTAVEVDAGHIYWGNSDTGAIGRANLDGSGVQQSFIPGAAPVDTSPLGVAVDGTNIWWSNFSFAVPGSIGRADIDGTNVQSSFISGSQVANPCGVAVGSGVPPGSYVYWANPGLMPDEGIARSGAPPPPIPDGDFVPNAGQFPCWPQIGGSHIYWSLVFLPAIVRADLDGMNVDVVVQANGGGGLAIFGSKLYFADVTLGTISRSNLDGSTPDFAFITGAGDLNGLAVDSGSASPNGPGCGDLTLGKAKKNKRKGTAKLPAEVGCAGSLEVGGKGVKPVEKEADGAGEVKLPVKAKGKKKRKLKQKGKAKVEAVVTFTPTGGTPTTEDQKVKLVKK